MKKAHEHVFIMNECVCGVVRVKLNRMTKQELIDMELKDSDTNTESSESAPKSPTHKEN